jgi:hypothetical protein
VLGPVIVDVIQAQKGRLGFATTGAPFASIRLKHNVPIPNPACRIFCVHLLSVCRQLLRRHLRQALFAPLSLSLVNPVFQPLQLVFRHSGTTAVVTSEGVFPAAGAAPVIDSGCLEVANCFGLPAPTASRVFAKSLVSQDLARDCLAHFKLTYGLM